MKSYQLMGLIRSNQRIEVIKSNKGIGLIRLSHDIQSLHLFRCSITKKWNDTQS